MQHFMQRKPISQDYVSVPVHHRVGRRGVFVFRSDAENARLGPRTAQPCRGRTPHIMIVFDQLKKNDPHLRTVTWGVLVGLCVLFVGLWWVQVVSHRRFSENQKAQSFRTVRIPAIRGRPCNHRPSYA